MGKNAYGLILKDIRIRNNHKLEDMSKKLNVSIAFLSAIEVGTKRIPIDMIDRIKNAYPDLTEQELLEIRNAIDISNKKIIISLEDKNENQVKTILSFARAIDTITDEKLAMIDEILKK